MSSKRPYRLGKRQASVDETRRRILDAAMLEYQEHGIPDTSMQAVARRADVAPGTVLYHFPAPDDLAEAVIERWLVEMDAPSPELIREEDPLDVRLDRLAAELFDLYERSEPAYRIYAKSPRHPLLVRYETQWFDNVGRMIARALGDRATDPEALQVVGALLHPGFRGMLLEVGFQRERASKLAAELALGWLKG